METHPYDELYLTQVVETQGKLFEKLQDIDPPVDSEKLIEAYLRSDLRRQLDAGHAFFLTLDDEQLKRRFLESEYEPEPGEPLRGFMPNWIGRFYAYAQWEYDVPSAALVEKIPVADLTARYWGAHDLDLRLAVRKLCDGRWGLGSEPAGSLAANAGRGDEPV